MCCVGLTAAMLATAFARPEQPPSYGSYLADHFGSTCWSFLSAADTRDAVRLRLYGDLIDRLITEKWGALTSGKSKRLVLDIVTECEAHGGSDFESIAKQVIARSSL